MSAGPSSSNEPIFGVVSGWDISVESGLGGMEILPIHLRHDLRVRGLPGRHQDPFDRLLVAQALVEGLTIVTADPPISRYPVGTIW